MTPEEEWSSKRNMWKWLLSVTDERLEAAKPPVDGTHLPMWLAASYLRANPQVAYTLDYDGRIIITDDEWRMHFLLSTAGK